MCLSLDSGQLILVVAKIVLENELAVVGEILQTMKSGMAFPSSRSSMTTQGPSLSERNETTHLRDIQHTSWRRKKVS